MPLMLSAAMLAAVIAATIAVRNGHSDTLTTRWTAGVTPENAHREYPRPQLVRDAWVNLNGLWQFVIQPSVDQEPQPEDFTRQILVPFPIESKLSGVQEPLKPTETAWYRRAFHRPEGPHILLHIGASDWDTRVWVNGHLVGWHQGGYDPFSFDITTALKPSGEQTIVIAVTDPSDDGPQPRGKQSLHPQGIFYTPSSGIWQTVWLEPVPDKHIEGLRVQGSHTGEVQVLPLVRGTAAGLKVRVEALDEGRVVGGETRPANGILTFRIPHARPWTPDAPNLYDLRVTLEDSHGNAIDTVKSYVGLRDIAIEKDSSGVPRVMLNGKGVFLAGPLDQGFWPDGLYAAPTDEAYRYDIEVTKRLGFNMIRKHVKVEPQRWYWWADKLGVLVMQDMPSGDRSIGPNDPDIIRSPESRRIYETELRAMIDNLRDHPSIICWIPFNEGWGQFDTIGITKLVRSYDPTRLIDSTTGWSDRGAGDFTDIHVYPGPAAPKPDPDRAALLGEFGGLGLVVPGHTWKPDGWGYQSVQTRDQLTRSVVALFDNLRLLEDSERLVGAVYTQTSDVETELNGLMTYDRSALKVDEEQIRQAVMALYGPAPAVEQILPASDRVTVRWHYSTTQPEGDWATLDYDESSWSEGPGGFGTAGTPGAIIGTTWNGPDIWLRRTFELPHNFDARNLYLRVHHDDNAEVYLDGAQIEQLPKWTESYTLVPIPTWAEQKLTPGKHVLSIHCHQVSGGQYIDAGIVRLVQRVEQ